MDVTTKIHRATIRARVFHAATGEWEDLGIIWRMNGIMKNILDRTKIWLQSLRR